MTAQIDVERFIIHDSAHRERIQRNLVRLGDIAVPLRHCELIEMQVPVPGGEIFQAVRTHGGLYVGVVQPLAHGYRVNISTVTDPHKELTTSYQSTFELDSLDTNRVTVKRRVETGSLKGDIFEPLELYTPGWQMVGGMGLAVLTPHFTVDPTDTRFEECLELLRG